MKYRVFIERPAERAINRMATDVRVRVLRAAFALGNNPRPHGYLKLTGADEYRIRVGDYRLIYRIDDDRIEVIVVRAGHRSAIY